MAHVITVDPLAGSDNEVLAAMTLGKKRRIARTSANVSLDQSSTPWLAPSVLVAMRHAANLEISGVVDEVALAGVKSAQTVMHGWYPDQMREVVVTPESVVDPELIDGRGVGCFFSGGVDSFYSTVKHLDEITHLIFIHGFDIGLNNEDLAERTRIALRAAAADLGKPLIEVRTNLRQVHTGFGLDWEDHSHGSLLAHVAQLLGQHLSKIYLPASFPVNAMVPYATHPDLDPHWSSATVELVHDGVEASRPQKIAAFADNDAAMKNLRVCWYNRDNEYNCGKCEKCIRTMINIRIAGASGRCSTLPAEIPWGVYARTYMNQGGIESAQENLDAMRELGYEDPQMEAALREALKRSRLTNELLHVKKIVSLVPVFAEFLWTQLTSRRAREMARATD